MNHIYLSIGEDVHEGKTGLGFDYQGSVSQFAPDVDNIVALRQVDPAHYDKDKEKGEEGKGYTYMYEIYTKSTPRFPGRC